MSGDGVFATPRARALSRCAVVAMVVVYVATAPFSITHLDLARDVGISLDIALGNTLPVQGPVLAGSFHLGPVWYYLLALPLLATHSWLATILFVALLSATKFPLAYALGTRLVDRPFGLLWALLLLLPGWNTYETILLLHPSLVPACTLALLWFVVRYAEDGAPRHFVGGALMCALTLHAHPATFALALVAAILLAVGWSRRGMPLGVGFAGLVAGMLPFIPYLASQAAHGFPDLAGAAAYLQADNRLGAIDATGRVLWGTLVTGPLTVADAFFGANDAVLGVGAILYGTLTVVALLGIFRALAIGFHRWLIAAGIALVLVLALSVAAVRMTTPYYMTFVIGVPVMGLVALGLRAVADVRWLRVVVVALAGTIGIAAAATAAAAAATLAAGAYPFAFFPLFDVQARYVRGTPLPFVPAYAMRVSGAYLCDPRPIVLHGAYAVHGLHDYTIEAALRCDDVRPMIRLSGNLPVGAIHVTATSASMASALGFAPALYVGPLAVLPVARSLHPPEGIAVPNPQQYPPTKSEYGAVLARTLEFDARGDEVVLVTDAHFAFAPPLTVEATRDGRSIDPTARDTLTTAFACDRCDPAKTYRWRVNLHATAPERIDVVTVKKG